MMKVIYVVRFKTKAYAGNIKTASLWFPGFYGFSGLGLEKHFSENGTEADLG